MVLEYIRRPPTWGVLALTVALATALPHDGVLAPAQAQSPTKAQPQAQPQARSEQQAAPPPRTGPLFIDDAHEPTIMVAWMQRDGTRIELTRTLPWGTKNDRIDMGLNVLAFAAVGGTRIELQQGHPLGSVVRVGFYKVDDQEPFFTDIKPGSQVEVRLQGVKFIEDARPTKATALHHLQYALEDVLNCGLDGSAIDQYNTASAQDTLGGNVTQDNGRPGVLRIIEGNDATEAPAFYRHGEQAPESMGPDERFATVRYVIDEDAGTIGMQAILPYELFRHVRDPWLRAEPGTFFEPTHFHLEFENLPSRVPDEEEPQAEQEPQDTPRAADPAAGT